MHKKSTSRFDSIFKEAHRLNGCIERALADFIALLEMAGRLNLCTERALADLISFLKRPIG